nr:gustatory receptor 8 [Podabrus annulatus]
MSNIYTLYGILKPVYYIGRIFGLVPFNVNNSKIEKSYFGIVWSIIVMSTLTGFALFSQLAQNKANSDFGILMKLCNYMAKYLDIASMSIIIFCNCIHQNTVISVLKYLMTLDNKLQSHNVVFDLNGSYKKAKLWATLFSVIVMLYFIITVILTVVVNTEETYTIFVANIISSRFPNTIITITELEFCTIVLIFKERFKWLNDHILEVGQALLKSNSGTTNEYSNENPISKSISRIKFHHQQLYSASVELNDAFSIQILLLIASTFLNSIMTLFFWSIKSVHPTESFSNADALFTTTELSCSVVQIFFIVVICSQTAIEAQRSGALLHYIMPTTKVLANRKALQIQLSSFSLQLADYNVNFNACGVFPINETLIYTIVGTAATYLIIVIQFELLNLDSKNITSIDSIQNATL